jgi:cellulose synthase/poly-beta-1,6-N-acetylglucosamine synthase-like glycosyltransferase
MKTGPEEILLILFCTAALLQLVYYYFFFSRIAFHRKPSAGNQSPPVSIIICARSESSKLINNLPAIFDQDYPEFEVIVVNDRSWDDTKEILKAFQVRFPNLRVINIEESSHEHYGKKMALTIGIKGAVNEWVLLTDADCRPADRNWIREMTQQIDGRNEIVLGYSPYSRQKGFLNRLIRFDTFWAGLNYLSLAKSGIPYMGVGRNLMYMKSTFFRVSGFKKHYHISSGDDDLFVNQVANKKNIRISINPESHVISQPKQTFIDWFRQKKRHFTTAPFYRFGHKLLLSIYPVSLLLMLGLAIPLIVLNTYLWIILGVLGFRLLSQMIIFSRSMKWLGDKDLLLLSPVLELVLLFLHPVIHLSNKIVKATKWN